MKQCDKLQTKYWSLFAWRQNGAVGTPEFLTDGQQEVQYIVGVDEARKFV